MGEWRPTVTEATRLPPPSPARPAFDAAGLAAASGGRALRSGGRPIRGAAVDSRRVEPGNLFVALPGARTDGHRFLDEAVAAGATALLVSEAPDPAALDRLGDTTVLLVDDGAAALGRVAAAWRARFDPLVVGVTGSVAKTSTKEAVAAVLRTTREVLANEGNQNNEVGLPLTLLRLTPSTQAAVLEMGMYVEGDIAHLAALAGPTIGVVTAVRGVHVMRAGSLAAIEREKGRLVEALPATGTAVLNADDPLVAAMRARTPASVATYGFAAEADVTARDVVARGVAGMAFRLVAQGVDEPVEMAALGRHNVHNALAAAAVGLAAGLSARTIAAGLAAPWGAPHRSTLLRAGPWLVIDDTYNAGPDSMAAALDVLADLPGRRVAVLGEMLELGPGASAAHREVGRRAAGTAALLVTVGDGALEIAAGARAAGLPAESIHHAADADAATRRLMPLLRPGDTILVKGSHDVALDAVVADLQAAGGRMARA